MEESILGQTDIRQQALRRQRQRLHRLPSDEDLNNSKNKWDKSQYESFLDGRQGTKGLLSLEDENRTSRMHVPPVIKCECNGIEAIAVVSTSTVFSTISMDMVEKLRLTDQIIPDTRTAGSPLPSMITQPLVKGKVKYIDLSIGPWQQVGQFFVVETSPPDITLGVDFLRKTQSILNFEETSLHVGGVKGTRVPFLTTKDVLASSRRTTANNRPSLNGISGLFL